jgi:lipopolysaccharide transport system permease protein
MLRRLFSHRDLLVMLARRGFQIRYRQSALGLIWAVIPPLITVAMATLVFDKVARVDTGGVPYPLFVFSALVPWTFLATSLTFGVPSVASAQQVVTRLAFPRATLALSTVLVALIDLVIAGATFVIFAYATGNPLPATALWFPILLAIEFVLTAGTVLLLSAMNVFARDIKLMVPFLVNTWLFLTPVLYPLDSVPASLRDVYLLNPMTGVIVSFRLVLVDGSAPDFGLLATSMMGAIILGVVGVWYFGATESRFADVI